MSERFVMRHYGSCGHVVDTVSKESFDRYAAPMDVGCPIQGTIKGFQNEVTTEPDGTKIVHVHPLRYFACTNCIEADLAEEELDGVRRSVSLPKVLAKDEATWEKVKNVMREMSIRSFWIDNRGLWASFEELPVFAEALFLKVGAIVRRPVA